MTLFSRGLLALLLAAAASLSVAAPAKKPLPTDSVYQLSTISGQMYWHEV